MPRNTVSRRLPSACAAAAAVVLLATCSDDRSPGGIVEPQAVTVSVAVAGEGRVASEALGIDCPAGAAGVCSVTVESGTTVTMTATPAAGHEFVNWTEDGRLASSSPVYSFSAAANRALAANFGRLPTTRLSAAGRVHGFAGTVPDGLHAYIIHGETRAGAAVQPDGSFEVTADVLPGGDTYDLLIDTDAAPRDHHPALVRLDVGSYRDDFAILLVPLSWTIAAGTHAGTAVDVSMDAAFERVCTTPGDPNCGSFYPGFWSTTMAMWLPGSMPIPVAFDHERSTHAVGAADSVAFWTGVADMHEDWGLELFRPARMDELTVRLENGSPPDRAIAVRVENALTAMGREAQMTWWIGSGGFFSAAVIWVRTPYTLHNTALMTHELLHTLGFGHSCAWPTVMGSYGCPIQPRLTAQDVAYAQFGHALAWRHREVAATHSVMAARDGERVVLRGLPPAGAAAPGAAASAPLPPGAYPSVCR